MHGLRWLQTNIELEALEGNVGENLHAFFDVIGRRVRPLKRSGALESFFFTRKAPGLRLRFGFPEPLSEQAASAAAEIGACMNALVEERVVRSWFPSCYEPEIFQFGGPDAIEAVHEYFTADSLAWMRWYELHRKGATALGASVLSLCVMNDLFARVLSDSYEEIWDVWCSLATLHASAIETKAPTIPALRISHMIDRLDASERRVLRKYEIANKRLARRLATLHKSGRLLFAYRNILPRVALFHWNRYGLSLEERRKVFTAMTSAWSPHAQTSFLVSTHGAPTSSTK